MFPKAGFGSMRHRRLHVGIRSFFSPQARMIAALPMQQQMNLVTLDVCHDLAQHEPS